MLSNPLDQILATPGYSYFNKDPRLVGGKKTVEAKEPVKEAIKAKEPVKGSG
jgi:hypothetical protein